MQTNPLQMPEIYLISLADIQKYQPVGDLPQGRIDPYILKAMELDLKPVLNESLYYDFITKYTTAGAMYTPYQNLLNGTTYTYSGQTIQYPGIKAMLSAYTMARFLPNQQIQITRHSIVTKINDQSQPTPTTSITYLVNNLKAEAMSYQNQLEQYLLQNQSTYPLYGTFPSAVQSRTGTKFINSARGGGEGRFRGWWNGNYYD